MLATIRPPAAMPTETLIWRMYANAGMDCRGIARALNRPAVLTATGKGPWHPADVERVIAAAKRDLSAKQRG
jgi:hypothetical protein